VRQTVPQEFAEFQGSCAGCGATTLPRWRYRSIDRSLNERVSRKLPNYAARKRRSFGGEKTGKRGCTMVGNAWCSVRVNVEIYALSYVAYTTLVMPMILMRFLYLDERELRISIYISPKIIITYKMYNFSRDHLFPISYRNFSF